MKEIEVKILDFDEKSVRENLKKAGARYGGKVEQKRVVFDAIPDTTKEDEIFRVRTDGKRTTLTWKHRDNSSSRIDNTEEIEVVVSDFDKTVDIISKLWKGRPPYYQESKREKWDYNGTEIAIITWPLVPSFLEIEGESEAQIREAIKELGITGKDIGNTGLWVVFDKYGQHGKDAGVLRF